MKKILITLSILGTMFSCSDDYYESLNVDPTLPADVPADFLVNAATKALFDQMITPNQNLNAARFMGQYWTQTTYVDESNYNLNERNITGQHWTRIYTNVLYDLADAKSKIESYPLTSSYTQATKDNQLAIVEILQVYTWQQMVDTFGNIPYSEAFQGLENPAPVFDDARTIYNDLLSRISASIASLDDSGNGFGGDSVYEGDISKWKKFAASVKLKIAMRLADVDAGTAATAASQAVASGVFSSNADNFTLPYMSTQPNTNPLWLDLVLSGRQDFVGADTFVNILNDLNDPRRPIFLKQNIDDGVYVGGPYGAEGNTFDNSSQVGAILHEATFPGTLMDNAEIQFLLAEAVERGFIGGSAETFYNSGVSSSLEFWGVSEDDANAYLSSPDVAYSTASGTWKQKIARQFYIATYNNAFEGWSVVRKYDYPEMQVSGFEGLPSPMRYTYPISERTINPDNYEQAASAIGGDEQQTKLFWDVN